MSQHKMTVDNGAGVAVRADINLALKALASQSSGASAPSPTYPAQVWADTGTGRLKQRDAANATWVDKGPIDGAMAPLDSPAFTGQPQGNFPCLVGCLNAKMSIPTASASGTLTADEAVIKPALGGFSYRLGSLSKAINLATTGAGGMDTGTAPVSGFVALYVIYNPVTQASALLAVNATSAKAGEVYGGANMPSGYTASALAAVLPTNGSGQFKPVFLQDRDVFPEALTVLSTTTSQGSFVSLNIAAAVPKNAKTVDANLVISGSATGVRVECGLAASGAPSNLASQVVNAAYTSSGIGEKFSITGVPLITEQVVYYFAAPSSGSLTGFIINSYGYSF